MRLYETTPLSMRQKGNNIFLAVLFFILLILSLFIDPREASVLNCNFKSLTGYGCPTCGLSRSFYASANLNIIEAFSYHLLGPLFFFSIVVLFIKSATEIALKKKIILTIHSSIAKATLIILMITWFLFWMSNFY